MQNTPIKADVVASHIKALGLKSLGSASIREIRRLVNGIEQESGQQFVHMEMGIPGLNPPAVAIEAEIAALRGGCAARYPDVDGTPDLKNQISRFIKGFIDLDISPRCCLPTTGSMNGSYASFMVAGKMFRERNSILFLDPSFPVQRQQAKMLGMPAVGFDVYHHRGAKLEAKLRAELETGRIAAILYSNPNNPSWICFTPKELEIIGRLATEFRVVVIEDLAYFAMDFRQDLSQPGKPPFQVSVGKYTDNYILLISSSKSFSYAGQRIGMLAISDKLFDANFEGLSVYFPSNNFGHSMVYGAIYAMTAGITHSAQYGLAAILKEVNEGRYNFVEQVRHYGRIAAMVKPVFLENGFEIVYDRDEDKPIADGFYFTVSHAGYTGEQLVEKLMYYGVSAIPLSITGSTREGIRACMSLITDEQIPVLRERLSIFKKNHSAVG